MKKSITFQQIVEKGCGIDIHKKVLVATIRGTDIREKTRTRSSKKFVGYSIILEI